MLSALAPRTSFVGQRKAGLETGALDCRLFVGSVEYAGNRLHLDNGERERGFVSKLDTGGAFLWCRLPTVVPPYPHPINTGSFSGVQDTRELVAI